MHTIKGPIHFKRGERIPDKFFKGVKMVLPFTAENFRSTKNHNMVEGGKKLYMESDEDREEHIKRLTKQIKEKQETPAIPVEKTEPGNPGELVTVKAHEKDVIPGEGVEIKKIKSYKRRKRVSRK